jgi:hypothetical protein
MSLPMWNSEYDKPGAVDCQTEVFQKWPVRKNPFLQFPVIYEFRITCYSKRGAGHLIRFVEADFDLGIFLQLLTHGFHIAGLKIETGLISKPESHGPDSRLIVFIRGKKTELVFIREINAAGNVFHPVLLEEYSTQRVA